MSVWPAIEHVPGPAYAGLIDQAMPEPAGSVSLSVAPVSVPVPGAEPFIAVTVKPMAVPALTLAASAALVTMGAGHCTVVVAVFDVTAGWLVARKFAEFE